MWKLFHNGEFETSKKISEDLDVGQTTLKKAQYIWNNADEEIIKQLDEGKLSINKAYNTLKEKLKEKDEENKKLQNQLELEQNKPKEKEYIEKIVDNTDYSLQSKLNKIENELREKTKELSHITDKTSLLERELYIYKQDSMEYEQFKKDVEYLTKTKEDLGRQIDGIKETTRLVCDIDDFLKNKLAPMKYSKSILDCKNEEVVIDNLSEIVNMVQDWCYDIKNVIPNLNNNFVEGVVIE